MNVITRSTGAALAATLAIILTTGGAASAESGTPAQVQPPPAAPDAFRQAMAARQVAEFARRQKDAQALIVAARMLQEVPFQDAAGGADAASPAGFTPEGLFAEARDLAKGNQVLLMQISVAESTGARGVASSGFGKGLLRTVQPIGARASYAFSIKAKAGELLNVGAIGDVNTKMVMRMRDAQGKVVCDADSGDYAPVCSFRPQGAADFKVELVNRSDSATRAVILSN